MRYSYNKNKRKLNYMILIIMILVISIGYAVLSTNLNIVGAGTINNPTWNIHWENVSVKTGSVSASTPTIDTNKTTVNYSVTLTIPGDYYEFTVDAVNAGTIDGMVSVISNKLNGTEITTLPSYLEYKVSYVDDIDIEPNHLLVAGASEKYKVHIGYKKDISVTDMPLSPQTLNLSFSVTYVQSDNRAEEIVHKITGTRYTVNGYEGNLDDNIFIGKEPTDNIILYNTAEEAKAAFFDRKFYLKHELEYGIVKDSYACIELNDKTYCLRGQHTYDNSTNKCKSEFFDSETNKCIGTYYESNKAILRDAFGESNCTEQISSYGSSYSCELSDMWADAETSGYVATEIGTPYCEVDYYGCSVCYF